MDKKTKNRIAGTSLSVIAASRMVASITLFSVKKKSSAISFQISSSAYDKLESPVLLKEAFEQKGYSFNNRYLANRGLIHVGDNRQIKSLDFDAYYYGNNNEGNVRQRQSHKESYSVWVKKLKRNEIRFTSGLLLTNLLSAISNIETDNTTMLSFGDDSINILEKGARYYANGKWYTADGTQKGSFSSVKVFEGTDYKETKYVKRSKI